jgi:hypothetical protein
MGNIFKLKSKQRGITFFGMLFFAAMVGAVFVIAAKVVPTAVEYQAILKAVNAAKQLPRCVVFLIKIKRPDILMQLAAKTW